MADTEIKLIEFGTLDVRDGDIIILRLKHPIDLEHYCAASEAMYKALDGAKIDAQVVIADTDTDISILRPSK